MGHESGDVTLAVADSGDIVYCTVGIAGVVVRTVGSCVAENHLAVLLELGKHGVIAVVIAIGVRDGNFEDLAIPRGVGERCVRLLDAHVHVAADEAQAAIAHHRAGEQAGLAQNLEAVADAEYHSAAVCEFFDGLHHRGKTRDGAGAQIIAVGKSAGQNNGVAIRQIFGLVPDEFDRLLLNVADGVERVMVAIGPGENDDSKFHAVAAPCSIAGTSILAHTCASHSIPWTLGLLNLNSEANWYPSKSRGENRSYLRPTAHCICRRASQEPREFSRLAPAAPRTRHRDRSPKCRRLGRIHDAQCWAREGLRYQISQIEFQRHPAPRWQTRADQANSS